MKCMFLSLTLHGKEVQHKINQRPRKKLLYDNPKYVFYTNLDTKVAPACRRQVDELNLAQSELNYIFLRFADILLMHAEARNEAVVPDQSVYDALKLIRLRAKMPEFTPGLTKEQMRQEIRHERRIELAGEGMYF